ncbi:hypothetical protein D3C74_339070 [compost metagenome]
MDKRKTRQMVHPPQLVRQLRFDRGIATVGYDGFDLWGKFFPGSHHHSGSSHGYPMQYNPGLRPALCENILYPSQVIQAFRPAKPDVIPLTVAMSAGIGKQHIIPHGLVIDFGACPHILAFPGIAVGYNGSPPSGTR